MFNMSPVEAEEDVLLVKKHILLVILLDVLERDLKKIAVLEGIVIMHLQYYLRSLQDKVILELGTIRHVMKRRGVKVKEMLRTDKGIQATYLCRGYGHTFTMLWSLVKAELTGTLLRLREGRAL